MYEKNLFALIPKVDEILSNEIIINLLESMPRKIVLDSIRKEIDILRNKIKEGNISKKEVLTIIDSLPENIQNRSLRDNMNKLKRVVNATGVVIHTNLGRSLINKKAIENLIETTSNYSNLEYNLDNGERGSRYSHLESIISEIVGGESAMVVNNNAAAVLLVLSTLTKGKEAIVSRGELVEIGGSFRIPDVLEQSGASLVAVGTTNQTHLSDYENAINENTGGLLKIHTSNYRILGFTSSVDIEELYKLKVKYDIPLIEDLGSGVLIDLSKYGMEYEPTVQQSIKNGVDIVTFSGDKLLGGPQAGIIVGKKKYIDEMKKNPLTRAFRVDKFTIAALESTLRLYLDEESAVKEIPTLKMLTMDIKEIESKALDLMERIRRLNTNGFIDIDIEDSYSEVGGGSLPLEKIPSKSVVLEIKDSSTQAFERKLRGNHIPIITRLYKDKIYMDLRTIKDDEICIIVDSIESALKDLEECIE